MPMQLRRALVVANAIGAPEEAASMLARAGVPTTVTVSQLDHAFARLHAEAFDVLLVPVHNLTGAQWDVLSGEIRATPALSVIGTSPAADPQLILQAMRAGVHEFLIAPPSMADLAGAVQRLGHRVTTPAAAGRVIAVYSAKGGLGATSVAVNMADALSLSAPAGNVALIDGVFTGGDVRVALNLRPLYDLGDVARKLHEIDSGMLRSLMTTGPRGMSVLPASEDPLAEEAFNGATVGAIINQLRAAYDTVLIDCEHQLGEGTLTVLDASDTILLVTQPSVPALRNTKRTLQLFERLGYNKDKVAVILNRFQAGDVFTMRTIADALGCEVYWGLPNDYRTASAALNKGTPISAEDPGSKLSRSFVQLAEKLVGASGTAHSPPPQGAGDPAKLRLRTLFGKQRGLNAGEITPHVA